MGIRNLNRFLQSKCRSITKIPLSHLSGKVVVVDASIYIYKYLSEDSLLESFTALLALLRQYDITPNFVFDGKPPAHKNDVLAERKIAKKEARAQYDALLLGSNLSEEELQKKKTKLKRSFVRVTIDVLQSVKDLLTESHVRYIDAPAEADQLCAYMVKKNLAYACVSDDMDMFAYDCDVVIRELSLAGHSCMLYNTNQMKRELKIRQFQEILVLCGTDYNKSRWTVEQAFQLYRQYDLQRTQPSYHEWLDSLKYVDKQRLQETYQLFTLPAHM